jgi:hypothetical protein
MAEELLEAQPLPHLFEQVQQIYLLASSSQVEPVRLSSHVSWPSNYLTSDQTVLRIN